MCERGGMPNTLRYQQRTHTAGGNINLVEGGGQMISSLQVVDPICTAAISLYKAFISSSLWDSFNQD